MKYRINNDMKYGVNNNIKGEIIDYMESVFRDDKRNGILYNHDMIGGRNYYVYILSNQSRTLYIGLTNNIKKRVRQHKDELIEGFTKRYKINILVYFESFGDVYSAIAREKQIKHWRREKKLAQITKENPEWRDLSDGW